MIIDHDSQEYKDNEVKLREKFLSWDVIKASGSPMTDSKAVLMLRDPSVFAYAFLRDENGKPFRVTEYQDLILNCKHDFTPDGLNRFVLFKASNQIGKTICLAISAIHSALMEDNIMTVIVSKSLPQSQSVLSHIRLLLNRSMFANTWKEDLGDQANTTILSFSRNEGKVLNRIICAPCGEGLLGYPVHRLMLDEADFYEDAKNFFYKIALPRTNQTKGQIMVFSNPNPDLARASSLLWDLWTGELFKRKFSFCFMDAPWNTQLEHDRMKAQVPSYIFSSTFDGEFGQVSGAWLSQQELDRLFRKDWDNVLPHSDVPVYLAMDFGKVIDNSVLSLGIVKYENGIPFLDVRYIQVFELKTPYTIVISRLKEVVEYYNTFCSGVAGIGFDKTGVGGSMTDFAQLEKDMSITDISWSLERRTKLFGDGKLMVETDRLHIVHTDEALKQFSGLTFKATPQGYLKIENVTADIHDDIPSSVLMLISIAIKPKTVTPGMMFIGYDKPRKDSGDKANVYEWTEPSSDEDLADIMEANNLRGIGV